MGKRYGDHESTLDTPTNKKRKTESSHQQPFVDHTSEHPNKSALVGSAADVTYSLTTDLVDGVVLTDLCAKKWRCGKPIGKFLSVRSIQQILTGFPCLLLYMILLFLHCDCFQ